MCLFIPIVCYFGLFPFFKHFLSIAWYWFLHPILFWIFFSFYFILFFQTVKIGFDESIPRTFCNLFFHGTYSFGCLLGKSKILLVKSAINFSVNAQPKLWRKCVSPTFVQNVQKGGKWVWSFSTFFWTADRFSGCHEVS